MTPITILSATRESIETRLFGLTFRTIVGIKTASRGPIRRRTRLRPWGERATRPSKHNHSENSVRTAAEQRIRVMMKTSSRRDIGRMIE
jgi:hypothetical protein